MEFTQFIQGSRLLIGGHRGHLSATRENTIANFKELLFSGIEYIEIDVQLSRDDEAVIFHDSELSHQTSLNGRVRDHSVSEMKNAFDLCTLDEALSWCKGSKMFALLEIKSRDYDETERSVLAQKIIAAVGRDPFQDRCIPLSIDSAILRLIKKSIPAIHLALIVPKKPADSIGLMKTMQASIYLSYLEDLDKRLVDLLHAAGYAVGGSVVNTEAGLDLAISLGVDMIESDYPAEMLELLRKRNV